MTTTTTTTTTKYRVIITPDDYAGSPNSWDEPLTLHTDGNIWTFVGKGTDTIPLDCETCGIELGTHIELETGIKGENGEMVPDLEEWGYQTDVPPHTWVQPSDVAAYVYIDGYGPYATIQRVDIDTVKDDPDHYLGHGYGRRESSLGALVKADYDGTREWVDGLPDNDPNAEYDRERLIEGIIELWRTFFEGRVWSYRVERLVADCDKCGRGEFWENDPDGGGMLSGIYGEDDNDDARLAYVRADNPHLPPDVEVVERY